MKIFSLCYTSARPDQIAKVVALWMGKAAQPFRVEVVISTDAEDLAACAAAKAACAVDGVSHVVNTGPRNCVSGWNTAAAASTGKVLIGVADDFMPPHHWDTALMSLGHWTDLDTVVAVSDGYNRDLFTLTIMTRKRYTRFGYMFYPDYESLFCDTEFTHVALQERAIVDGRRFLFEHLHPDCNKRERDAADAKHASPARWRRGETLFNYRKQLGFPNDINPDQELKYALYVQAIRDDLCLEAVCRRIIQTAGDCLEAVYFFVPHQFWSGEVAPAEFRLEVTKVAQRLRAEFSLLDVQLVFQQISDYQKPGESRIRTETRARNAALNHIHGDGFDHILIADGDELWSKGLFAKLDDFVRHHKPASVYTGMVPVIGVPGYPVEGALDKATIYIGPGVRFSECRGAEGLRLELKSSDVMHFTATRRTIEEVVQKHRESGHYDDPDYAMEKWINEILLAGKIKPGLRNAHMWTAGVNVWPLVRQWTPTERSQIPEEVKPYAGE